MYYILCLGVRALCQKSNSSCRLKYIMSATKGVGGTPPYLGDISREQPLIVKDYPPIGPIWNVTQALNMLSQSRCERCN